MLEVILPHSIARISYLIRHILFVIGSNALIPLYDSDPNAPLTSTDFWLLLLGIAVAAYWILYIVRPRCRNMGINARYCLLALVPLVNLLFAFTLLFIPPKVQSFEPED